MSLINILAAFPQTGDDRNIVLYIAVAAIAAAIIVVLFVMSHNSKKK